MTCSGGLFLHEEGNNNDLLLVDGRAHVATEGNWKCPGPVMSKTSALSMRETPALAAIVSVNPCLLGALGQMYVFASERRIGIVSAARPYRSSKSIAVGHRR
jgi:hypothetical protein